MPSYMSNGNRSPLTDRYSLPESRHVDHHYRNLSTISNVIVKPHDPSTMPITLPGEDTPSLEGKTPVFSNVSSRVSLHDRSSTRLTSTTPSPDKAQQTNVSSSIDDNRSKFNSPMINFGKLSTKTSKPKRTKSQSRADEMYNSSASINTFFSRYRRDTSRPMSNASSPTGDTLTMTSEQTSWPTIDKSMGTYSCCRRSQS
jgi:hypothetical protein